MPRRVSRLCFAALGAATLLSATRPAAAQDLDALRAKYLLPINDVGSVVSPGGFFRGAPGTNSGSPLAFGPSWGDAFVGAGYQSSTRGVKDPVTSVMSANGTNDGSVSAGMGFGDARDAIGLEAVVTTLSTVRSGFFNRTAFSFKVHRMLDNTSALALGVENAFIAGGQKTDGTASVYAVASKVFFLPENSTGLFKAATFSAGLGNGRFRFINDIVNDRSTVNFFGAGSLMVNDMFSAIADWTGTDLNLGLSIVPFKQFPVVFTPSLADVTQQASKSARFILGVGIGMHF